jgi:RNA polymerase sigma-70 factor (sigma-E family)
VTQTVQTTTDVLRFEDFVHSRLPGLLRYAHLLAGNPHDASDLVQTALERTGVRWRSVVAGGAPDAYVRKAILNAHVSRWRRRRRETLVAEVSEGDYVATRAGNEGGRDEMWAALATLPRRQRAVLVLRYYEDLSEREIATVLGISTGTVKSQASRALQALRSAMAAERSEVTS